VLKLEDMILGLSHNKKIVITVLVLVVAVACGFLWYRSLLQEKYYTNEMYNATIIEMKDSSIVVDGTLSIPPPAPRINKKIEFLITPETIITKKVMIMDLSKSSNQPQTPETRIETGDISDLKIKKHIDVIRGAKNLVDNNKVVAEEIRYLKFIYENKPQ